MNKRTIAIIATVVLCCIFVVIVSIEYKNQKALKEKEDNYRYQFQQEMTTEEQEETEKPIEIKDNTDDGFSELIPLAPVTQ